MTQSIIRVQRNKNVTLPIWVLKQFHVGAGDYLRLEQTREGVLLKPAKLVDPSQAYFWTKEWQEGEREAEDDIRKGRVKRFKSVKELIKDLKKA